jgi:hypothetical protein
MSATIGFSLDIRDIHSERLKERIPIKSKSDYYAAIKKYENDSTAVIYQVVTPLEDGIPLTDYYELMGLVL